VRQFSPVITIGGGIVLDPLARRPARKDTGRVAFLRIMQKGTAEEIVRGITERNVLGVRLDDLVARTGWLESEVRSAAAQLEKDHQVRRVAQEPLILLAEKQFAEICEKLRVRIERFHKENPLVAGIPREELRATLGKRVRPEAFQTALSELVRQNKIALQGEVVKKSGSEITLTSEEAQAKDQIARAFQQAGLTVPSAKEVLSQVAVESRRAEKLLQILLRENVLVRVSPELIFHTEALQKIASLLKSYKTSKGERIGVPSFKDLTGVTRKYAIPLLEYLDRQRLTRRAGDERVIL
jgi:selenocysteine-specific elongation factor